MKRLILYVASAAVALGAASREYQPVLEDGKSWLLGCQIYNGASRPSSPSIGMRTYQRYCQALVVGDTVILEKPCKIVRLSDIPESSQPTDYYVNEDNGLLSFYSEEGRDRNGNRVIGFRKIADIKAVAGDSLRCNYNDYFVDEPYYNTFVPNETTTTKGADEIERKEILFQLDQRYSDYYNWQGNVRFNEHYLPFAANEPKPRGFSWVEGIGVSRTDKLLSKSSISHGCLTPDPFYYLIECRKDGKTIFRNTDFGIKSDFGLLGTKTLLPGRSWTLEQNGRQFSVIVDRDTIIGEDPYRVLSASDGRKFLVNESNDCIYAFVEWINTPKNWNEEQWGTYYLTPHQGALPIVDFNKTDLAIYRRDAETNTPFLSPQEDASHRDLSTIVTDIKPITVNGNEFMEYIVTDRLMNKSFSWVEGVGAADSNAWISLMPEDHKYKLIDCRQDGEVIFTANDFSIPSTMKSSINEIAANKSENGAIYDLQGRRVANPGKGLYIIDGRKTLIR